MLVSAGPGSRRSRSRSTSSSGLLTRLLAAFGFVALLFLGLIVFATQQLGIPLAQLLGSEDRRLAEAPDVRPGGGSFAFMQTQPGRPGVPVTYNPCRPIEVVVNPELEPDVTEELIPEALDRMAEVTGLVFELVGETDERPDSAREDTSRGPSPVLISWSTPEETPELEGDVAGIGGSLAVGTSISNRLTYVTGTVTLDAPALDQLMDRADGLTQVRAILLHELAHLVGLAHVDDTNELLHPSNSGRVDFGPGDLEGLALLGSGLCRG